jgi:hypothetical protein
MLHRIKAQAALARYIHNIFVHRKKTLTPPIVRLSCVSEGVKGGRVCQKGGWRRDGKKPDVQVAIEGLLGLILEEGNEVVSVLGLLETAKGHLGAGNILLGVLEVLKLWPTLGLEGRNNVRESIHTKVFSSHVMPFCLFASV